MDFSIDTREAVPYWENISILYKKKSKSYVSEARGIFTYLHFFGFCEQRASNLTSPQIQFLRCPLTVRFVELLRVLGSATEGHISYSRK